MINSDSHSHTTIGCQFDEALKIAWECGFRRITVLGEGCVMRELVL